MGIADLFKKKEEPSFNPDMNFDPGKFDSSPAFAPSQHEFSSAPTFPEQPSVNLSSAPQQQFAPQGSDLQKDIQIISLKLDAIKAELDSMNQRIKNIEHIAEKEQQPQAKKWY